MIVPGNRFEYLEARAALDAIDDGELDPENLPPRHARRARPAYPRGRLRRAVRRGRAARRNPLRRALRRPHATRPSPRSSNFIATGGYALKAYDKFRRLVREARRPLAHRPAGGRRAAPDERRHHRRAAADGRALQERPQARHDRGRLRLDPDARRPFLLRRPQPRGRADQGQRHHRPRLVEIGADRHLRRPAHVDVDPPRQPRPPHARRPQRLAPLSRRRPRMARGAGPSARCCPSPTSCWSKPSRTKAATTWSPTASKAGTRTSRSAC